MAEPDVDEDLFADLYDGDGDNDTADANPIKAEEAPAAIPEAVQSNTLMQLDGFAAAAVKEEMPSGDDNGFDAESYYNNAQQTPMHGMADSRPEERPIGIKEDG